MESKLVNGNCLDELKNIPENSIDAIITDPPYGYSFMNKIWDVDVPSVEIWKACLRVLKSGAFAFIMSSPRQDVSSEMIHRLKLAGFDIAYDPIEWVYASGFPKAQNIAKGIDNSLLRKWVLSDPKRKIDYDHAKEPVKYLKSFRRQWAKEVYGVELEDKPFIHHPMREGRSYETNSNVFSGDRKNDVVKANKPKIPYELRGYANLQKQNQDQGFRKYTNGLPVEQYLNAENTRKSAFAGDHNPEEGWDDGGQMSNEWMIEKPVSPEAKAVDGMYSYSPKPSREIVFCCMKKLSTDQNILVGILTIIKQICQLKNVLSVIENSMRLNNVSNFVVSNVMPNTEKNIPTEIVLIAENLFTLKHQIKNIVRDCAQIWENVLIPMTKTLASYIETMDILPYLHELLKTNMENWNIEQLWNNTLIVLCPLMSVFTIKMGIDPTIELKILKSYLDQITQNYIFPLNASQETGLLWNVIGVTDLFLKQIKKYAILNTTSVHGNVTDNTNITAETISVNFVENISSIITPSVNIALSDAIIKNRDKINNIRRELILVVQKPILEDSNIAQASKWQNGGVYFDRCRIPAEYEDLLKNASKGYCGSGGTGVLGWNSGDQKSCKTSDHPPISREDQIKILKKVVGGRLQNPITFGQIEQTGFKIRVDKHRGGPIQYDGSGQHDNKGWNDPNSEYCGPNSFQEIDLRGRFPANLLVSDNVLDIGEKTNPSTKNAHINNTLSQSEITGKGFNNSHIILHNNPNLDGCDFSDKFSLDRWWFAQVKNLPKNMQNCFPFLNVPKPTKKEKNKGLDMIPTKKVNDGRDAPIDNAFQRGETERKNIHPTVKPIQLFTYLIALSPTKIGDIILDPFAGSGTTAIACKLADRKYLCYEIDPGYYSIMEARVNAFQTQFKLDRFFSI